MSVHGGAFETTATQHVRLSGKTRSAAVVLHRDPSSTEFSGRRSHLIPHQRQQMVETLAHHLLQIIIRLTERGVAAGDEVVLLALHGAAGARAIAGGLADYLGIHRVDLAVEIGQFGIAADRLVDWTFGGGAIEARP